MLAVAKYFIRYCMFTTFIISTCTSVLCFVLLQVKVWKTSDGFCFITFSQHSAGVTGVTFTQSGKVIVSSSLDGTVRAFDMNKSVVLLLTIRLSDD